MKMEKCNHNHKGTKALQLTLFFIIMLAPFIAVLVESMIMIYNPNAINGYSGTPTQVFYDAISNLSNQTLFNWTTNTGIYTTISAMLTGFELGSGAGTLALLLTYWTLMTGIYIVFDIIIFIFTKITHLLQ